MLSTVGLKAAVYSAVAAALARNASAYWPAGTAAVANTSLTQGRARSFMRAMPAGLSAGTTTTRRLRAKMAGASTATRPACTASSICLLWAVAKTSPGAPSANCCASCCEPAKLKVTVVAGRSAAKSTAIASKASLSDAAAITVMGSPAGCADGVRTRAHPAISSTATRMTATRRIARRYLLFHAAESGTKSPWPNSSTPNWEMSSCVGTEMIQSTNCVARSP